MARFPLLALLAVLVATSAVAKDGAPSRLFPYFEEDAGVAILGEVAYVGGREEIVASGSHYQFLLSAGIADADLTDGRLAVVRYYCCGGRIAQDQEIWVYVPPAITVAVEDLVQVRMGRVPQGDDRGVVNTVEVLRQPRADAAGGPCRWEPDTPGLWMRVVYCTGLEQQGWMQRGKKRKLWYLPAGVQAVAATAAEAPAIATTETPAAGIDAAEPPAATGETAPAIVMVEPAPAVAADVPAPTGPDEVPVPVAAEDCIALEVERSVAPLVLQAAAAVSPPLDLRLKGSAEARGCSRHLALKYASRVDSSSQQRNRDGAAIAGLAGLLVGSITPWSCPTRHTLDGVLTAADGAPLDAIVATREQKRIGTMLVCGEVEHPNEEITRELAVEVLGKVAADAGKPPE